MDLLIVRHAESQGNATGDYSSAVADSLSTEGEKQALALADTLSAWSFDRIIASPRERALQTITPYLVRTDQTAEIWPEIAEACWHDEREPLADSWEPVSAPAIPHFSYRDGRMVMPGHPETFGQGLRRVHDTLRMLDGLATQSITVLMVTHGHVIRELLNLMLRNERMQPYHHENCGMTQLTFEGGWAIKQ